MIYINAFLMAGITCLIGQIILDNTKLTPGHITSMFTIIGVILSFMGIYDVLLQNCGGGATILITNFGHILYSGGIMGYDASGILGIFSGLLVKSSAIIVASIIFSCICVIFFKAKD